MTTVFDDQGHQLAVTRCFCPPLVVTGLNQSSVQVVWGFKKHLSNSVLSKLKKLQLKINPQFFREFKLIAKEPPKIGQNITVDTVFSAGDTVSVSAVSKGRGFSGVIKRYGFHRQPVTGGQSDRVRAPGAIGAQTPGKVLKGKKMPGHYGHVTKTIANLRVFAVHPDQNQILITGSLPGHFSSRLLIRKSK